MKTPARTIFPFVVGFKMALQGLLILPLVLTGLNTSASTTPPPHFTVELNVQVSNISKDTVISAMTNEFRKLGDVEVTTDESGLWIFYMNLTPIMDQKGLKGYAISTAVADRYSSKTLKELPSTNFKTPTAEKTVKDLSAHLVYFQEQSIATTSVDGLSKTYAEIVNHFNETYLMPVREDVDDYNHGHFEIQPRKFQE